MLIDPYHANQRRYADPVQYSSEGVREQTQQLASWTIGSLHSTAPSMRPPKAVSEPDVSTRAAAAAAVQMGTSWSDRDTEEGRTSFDSTQTIEEVTEPASPYSPAPRAEITPHGDDSLLSRMIRRIPSREYSWSSDATVRRDNAHLRSPRPDVVVTDTDALGARETAPLLPKSKSSDAGAKRSYGVLSGSIERWRHQTAQWSRFKDQSGTFFSTLAHPKRWNRRAMWNTAVVQPVSTLPAVFLGWLLNILDALSYGEFFLFIFATTLAGSLEMYSNES